MKKFGFTLAEVLITLVIIGVIAAMTVPTLMSKTQDNELKSASKKAFETLTQALKMVAFEDQSSIQTCLSSNDCTSYYDSLKSKLRVDKTYKGAVDGVNIPKYKTAAEAQAVGGSYLGTALCANNTINKEAWTLADGSMIISCWNSYFTQYRYFIIDINGIKGPNKWGYDQYEIEMNESTTGSKQFIFRDTYHYILESGGKTLTQRLLGE